METVSKLSKQRAAHHAFGPWLRNIREKRHITETGLATRLNTTLIQVRAWESETGAPSLATLMHLVYELDCDVSETNALFDSFAYLWMRGRA